MQAEKIKLRAGPLSMVFHNGDIRYVRLGRAEVLRRVYVAVRDRNWGTVPSSLSNLRIEAHSDSFDISYDCDNRSGGIHFRWQAKIKGEPDGTITWNMRGAALTTFLRNRIGFCVLHPIRECAGQPCMVRKADGSVQPGVFPKRVAPHQPFIDMGAISHEAAPGVTAEVRFTGDLFEMEDQRNWTDASFKAYSTPLRLPFPVEISAGTVVEQTVELGLSGDTHREPSPEQPAGVMFSIMTDGGRPLPDIGLGMASHGEPLGDLEVDHLKKLHLAHLRTDLLLAEPLWLAMFERASRESAALGVPLEVALTLSDAAGTELAHLAEAARSLKPRVCRWLVYHQGEKCAQAGWISLARKHLAGLGDAAFVSGTNANFAELNRNRPEPGTLDGACFSINPQVHAFDDETLVENLAAQAEAVESAREFLGDTPVVVSPVTLKMRFNPDATGPQGKPAEVDLRQMSFLGAGWTAGSLKYLSESGARSVTYYETTGPRGVMASDQLFPLYHVLASAGEFAGGEVLRSYSKDPLRVEVVAFQKDGRLRTILANLTSEAQNVYLHSAGLESAQFASLTTDGWSAQPAGAVLRLEPHALVRIDEMTPRRRA